MFRTIISKSAAESAHTSPLPAEAGRYGRHCWPKRRLGVRLMMRRRLLELPPRKHRSGSVNKKRLAGAVARCQGLRAITAACVRAGMVAEGWMRGNGTPGWNRTSDRRLRRPLLYPLSYGGAQPQLSKRRVFQESDCGSRVEQLGGRPLARASLGPHGSPCRRPGEAGRHAGSGSGAITSCRGAPVACGRASAWQDACPFSAVLRAWPP